MLEQRVEPNLVVEQNRQAIEFEAAVRSVLDVPRLGLLVIPLEVRGAVAERLRPALNKKRSETLTLLTPWYMNTGGVAVNDAFPGGEAKSVGEIW